MDDIVARTAAGGPVAGPVRAPEGYAPPPGGFDEMVGPDGLIREHWRPFAAAWFGLGADARAQLAARARRELEEAGLSYNAHIDAGRERVSLRFDPAPLLLSGEDWRRLGDGAVQRARLMELVLRDLYGPRSLISTGGLPPAIAFGSPEFIRDAARWDRAPRRRLFRYAVDVARDASGRWVVLDDHVDRPEGDGWALANRVALAQSAPDLFVDVGVRRLGQHFLALQEVLEEETGVEGRVALLTPGPSEPGYFSHAYLARYLGLMLVEPGDLAVRDGEAHVKTLEGLRRLDVILRATPSRATDPLYTPGAGAVSPAGILRAARLGRVIFANAVGAALLDGRAMAPFSGWLIRDLMGEEPILAEGEALWLGEAEARHAFLAAPEAFRVTDLRAPGVSPEPFARRDKGAVQRLLEREGWRHVARRPVTLATAPAFRGGALAPQPYALRIFVTAGPDGFRALPGGLAMLAPEAAATGFAAEGVAKDVWVAGDQARAAQPAALALLSRRRRTAHLRRTGRELLSRVADNLFWLGRNAERAEGTLRALKAVVERLIDAPRPDRDPSLLHRLLGLRMEGKPRDLSLASVRARAVRLALDPEEANGVGRLLDAIYWNANAARPHLSRDAWRDVSALSADPAWRAPPDPARCLSLAGPVDDAIRSLAAFAGASHENMTRNYAWRFLELGRRLERARLTAGLFEALACEAHDDEPATFLAILQLCDSFFAYRARYLTTPEATPAVDLLILDESNPRSLAFQIVRMEEVLDELPRLAPTRNPEHKLVLRLLTDLRTADAEALGATDAEGRRTALSSLLADTQALLARVSDLIAKAYFAHAEPSLTEVMAARVARRPARGAP